MKRSYFVICTLFLVNVNLLAQDGLKIGNRVIKPVVVTLDDFNITGTWKVIHRTYVASKAPTYELRPLEELNTAYYRQRKTQGELIYGSYVHFSDTLYIPYCPYLPSIVVNPEYKKQYVNTINNPQEYDPRFKCEKILQVDVLCPLKSDPEVQVEFSVLAFNNDLICILSNNANTFLERVTDLKEVNNKWKQDKEGFYYANFMGSSDIELFLPSKEGKYNIITKYNLENEKILKYIFIENLLSNDCNQRKTNKLFTTRNIPNITYPYETNVVLMNLKSNIIRISGGTEDQSTRWQVKWKIVEE